MSPSTQKTSDRVTVPGRSALPQVNLLPPEIRAGRQLTSIKSWLGIALLVTLLVASGLVVMTEMNLRSAEDALAETEDQNAALVAQQAQYAEVPAVLSQLENITNVRLLGMAPEVIWRPYIQALAATAPAGVSLDTVSVTMVSGEVVSTTGTIPTDRVIAVITFQAKSATLPDTAAWMDGLAVVNGLSDPWFTTAVLGSQNEVTHYAVNGTINVTYDALALRFLPVEETTAEPTDEATQEPTEEEG